MNTRILIGDCRDVLATLPERGAQMVCTSPPYFGLRDYGVAGQLGLEPTPAAYVEQLVAVFRSVRRVLADDGVVFLNLGDSYAGGKTGRADTGEADLARRAAAFGTGTGEATGPRDFKQRPVPDGLKPKDLIGIPWRVAFALQADGWYLRADIIWHKPNPMPESVRDRPTKAHEYVFLLSKQERYFYDAAAIAEPSIDPESINGRKSARNPYSLGKIDPDGFGATRGGFSAIPVGKTYPTRNARSVWTITPKPFRGAHFATFPPALAERCIRAGSRPGDVVLDPFAGAGTTLLVAAQLQRLGVGIELNPAYAAMAEARIAETIGGLAA